MKPLIILTPSYGKIICPLLTIELVDKVPWCCHSNETAFTELLHSAIHFFDFEIKIRFLWNFFAWVTLFLLHQRSLRIMQMHFGAISFLTLSVLGKPGCC